MSYVLGFIVADGCVGVRRIRKKDKVENYYFNITSKDKSILENIKKAMNSYHKIHSKKNGRNDGRKYYFIQAGCQEICKDLINLGVRPRKTYNLKSLNVPDRYFSDFVRGFFDGDGSVYIYNVNGVLQIKSAFVSTSFEFIDNFNNQLCKQLNIIKKNIHKDLPKREDQLLNKYYIDFYIDDSIKLSNFMYGNNPKLYLSRKRDVFEKWKSVKRRRYVKKSYPSKIKVI